jgi:hypothetical protein
LDIETRHRIENNLFHAARAAVEPWDKFKWHRNGSICDTWQLHSSQALAIDFFGTLKVAPAVERDAILRQVSARMNLSEFGPWSVELEWEDPGNGLRERRQSQVDAVATGECATILFECKFGESDGGMCSQTEAREVNGRARMPQCNGNYEMQVNPVNRKTARCALTGKGIRYWDLIPNVFRYDSESDIKPCPFNSASYQWMRNLVLAEEIRHTESRQAGFIIAYANHPRLPFPRILASPDWARFLQNLRMDSVHLQTISYQDLLRIAVDAVGSSTEKWRDLEYWVLEKISAVGEPVGTRTPRHS